MSLATFMKSEMRARDIRATLGDPFVQELIFRQMVTVVSSS